MSRHRNIRGLTADDYYDEIDYDDDNYDEEYNYSNDRNRNSKPTIYPISAKSAKKSTPKKVTVADTSKQSKPSLTSPNVTTFPPKPPIEKIKESISTSQHVLDVSGMGLKISEISVADSCEISVTKTHHEFENLQKVPEGIIKVAEEGNSGSINLFISDDELEANTEQSLSSTTRCPHLTMVVAGHVDAGKSTLVGNLLVKLGAVSQQTLHKYQKESKILGKSSFFLAWVMDEDPSERQHGVTIDLAEK